MAKVNKIYKVDTRDQVKCLVQLVGSQKQTLLDILEGIKPAVITTGVVSAASGYTNTGIYFQVFKDRKYLLRMEAAFSDAPADGPINIFVVSSDILNAASVYGYAIDGSSAISLATDLDPGDNGVGLTLAPVGEGESVMQAYGSVYFECTDNAVISIKFKDDTGDTGILPGSCFTLTEIMNND